VTGRLESFFDTETLRDRENRRKDETFRETEKNSDGMNRINRMGNRKGRRGSVGLAQPVHPVSSRQNASPSFRLVFLFLVLFYPVNPVKTLLLPFLLRRSPSNSPSCFCSSLCVPLRLCVKKDVGLRPCPVSLRLTESAVPSGGFSPSVSPPDNLVAHVLHRALPAFL